MDGPLPYFNVPQNLSHAATVAARIRALIAETDGRLSMDRAEAVCDALADCRHSDPDIEMAEAIKLSAEQAGVELVEMIELEGIGNDQIGQRVRNLFENLGEGKLGSEMGLRAGENPASLQRPL